MTEFRVALEHSGLKNNAIGVNFITEEHKQFIYISLPRLWEEAGKDYDEFVRGLIITSLCEYVCSKSTKISKKQTPKEAPILKEGKLLRTHSLCSNPMGLIDKLIGKGCKCLITTTKMLEGLS